MENPLVAIRKEKGLTVSDLGVLTGTSLATIQRVEKGNLQSITPAVLNFLEKLGYDREQITADYDKWKSYRVKQLQREIG